MYAIISNYFPIFSSPAIAELFIVFIKKCVVATVVAITRINHHDWHTSRTDEYLQTTKRDVVPLRQTFRRV
jgi:hypothetical protein